MQIAASKLYRDIANTKGDEIHYQNSKILDLLTKFLVEAQYFQKYFEKYYIFIKIFVEVQYFGLRNFIEVQYFLK